MLATGRLRCIAVWGVYLGGFAPSVTENQLISLQMHSSKVQYRGHTTHSRYMKHRELTNIERIGHDDNFQRQVFGVSGTMTMGSQNQFQAIWSDASNITHSCNLHPSSRASPPPSDHHCLKPGKVRSDYQNLHCSLQLVIVVFGQTWCPGCLHPPHRAGEASAPLPYACTSWPCIVGFGYNFCPHNSRPPPNWEQTIEIQLSLFTF